MATKRLAPLGYDHVKPFLDAIYSGPAGQAQGPDWAAIDAAWNKAPAAAAPQQDTPWDKTIHVAGRVLDGLASLGYGVTGAADKSIQRQREQLKNPHEDKIANLLQNIGAIPGDFLGSVGDALGGNTANLRTGSDVIEHGTDLAGERTNKVMDERGIAGPRYQDTADNVNPWVKGIGGFAIDALGDPLTYVPGGAAISAVKGATKGARAAAIAKEGGDLAKTAAWAGAIPGGAKDGFMSWVADTAAQRAQKAAVKLARKTGGQGDLGTYVPEASIAGKQANAAAAAAKEAAKTPVTTVASVPDGLAAAAAKVDQTLAADAAAKEAHVAQTVVQNTAQDASEKLIQDAAKKIPKPRTPKQAVVADAAKQFNDPFPYVDADGVRWADEAAYQAQKGATDPTGTIGHAPRDRATFEADTRDIYTKDQIDAMETPVAAPKAPAEQAAAEQVAADASKQAAQDTERSLRADQAAALGDPVATGVANLPVTSDQALATLRNLTYTTPIDATVRKDLRAIRPFDATADAPTKKAWMDHVTQVTGSRDEMNRLRTLSKDDLAVEVEKLANARVQKDYAGASLSDIERGLKTKKRVHDDAHLQAFAKSLGIDRRNFSKAEKAAGASFTDYFNRVRLGGENGVVGRMILAEKAAKKSFATAIPGGTVAEEAAKAVEPAQAAQTLAEEADALAASIPPAHLDAYEKAIDDVIPQDFAERYRHKGLSRGANEPVNATDAVKLKDRKGNVKYEAWQTYTFNQTKTYSYFKSVLGKGSAEAKAAGLSGTDRAAYLTQYMTNAVKYLDTRLRSLGVSPTTGKTAYEAKLLKTGGDSEWAFLGLSDVFDALGPHLVKSLLFEGKDISISPTLLHDAARWALKASHAEGTEGDRLNTLIKTLTTAGQNQITGVGKYAARNYLETDAGKQSIKALAGIFLSPDVLKKLETANLKNSAFAIATVGKDAQRASKPIVTIIAQRAASPFGTGGSVSDIILKAHDDLAKGLRAEKLDGTLAEPVAKDQLDKGIAESITSGDLKRARAAKQMRGTAVDSSGNKLDTSVREAAKEDAAQAAQKATGARSGEKKPKAAPTSEAKKKAAQKGAQAANAARAEEVTDVIPETEEIVDKVVGDMIAAGEDEQTARLATRAELSMGLPTWLRMMDKVGETFHGSFGMDKLKYHEVSLAMSSRKWTAGFNRAVNALQKKYDEPTQRAAFALFQKMKDNEDLPRLLDGADPQLAAAATELWDAVKVVFDHSDHTLFDRAGLSADYINDFLFRGGVPAKYTLQPGAEGWALGTMWKSWEFDDTVNPLDLLKQYNAALSRAQTVPSIAASFSAQFGHRSSVLGNPMTDAEARAAGWEKIDVNSGDGRGVEQFIDPTQYYPPEMIQQLSRMNIYLTTSKVLDGNTLWDKSFRYIDPITNALKSSLTLWRPGHHATNMMGEGLMNTLAGVTNPARYGDAMSLLRSQGLMDKGGEDITAFLKKNAPDGFTLKATDDGKGVWMSIGGKTSRVSYDSAAKLLERAGVIIHHSNAEDLITDSYGHAAKNGLQGVLDKVSHATSPHFLGQFSASRDNLFRVAHALDILNKRSFRSIDDAMEHVSKEVHAYHPTMQTLSAREQKYIRRIAYFYTWQRQALVKVVESMIDTPGRVMMAPKALYNVSEANDTQPQSFGNPLPNDPRIPGYSTGKMTSFLWNGDELGNPTHTGLDQSFLWSASISAPQLDILQGVFGSVKINPDRPFTGQVTDSIGQLGGDAVLGNLAPWIKVPMELSTGTKIGGVKIKNTNEYLIDQTGLGYASRAGLLGPRSDDPTSPQSLQARHETTLKNFVTGMKLTNETTAKAVANAQRGRDAETKRMIQAGQIAP